MNMQIGCRILIKHYGDRVVVVDGEFDENLTNNKLAELIKSLLVGGKMKEINAAMFITNHPEDATIKVVSRNFDEFKINTRYDDTCGPSSNMANFDIILDGISHHCSMRWTPEENGFSGSPDDKITIGNSEALLNRKLTGEDIHFKIRYSDFSPVK